MTKLETVDLRENELLLSDPENLAAVMAVLTKLPRLRSIGLCGNWDARDRSVYVMCLCIGECCRSTCS